MKRESILKQLKKYLSREQKSQIEIIVPSNNIGQGIDIMQLAEQIVNTDHPTDPYAQLVPADLKSMFNSEMVAKVYKRLQTMPIFPDAGNLYPIITLARYHLAYNEQYPTSEINCDEEIANFMRHIDLPQYKDKFTKRCDEITRKIVLVRALLATFNFGKEKRDNIIKEHRPMICKALKVNQIITLSATVKMQESLHREANMEQLILGRFGYMMMWNWINSDREDEVPLLNARIPRIGHE